MYTLPDGSAKRDMRRYSLSFLCITLFCGLFSAVYEYFSHGVYSGFMVYLFVFPLVGGVLPYGVLGVTPRAVCPSPALARIYNSGVAALATGSCVQGVLDIYGTRSVYMPVYWVAGAVLVLIPLALYAIAVAADRSRRTDA